MKIGILGKGEIGSAVEQLYLKQTREYEIRYKDPKLNLNDNLENIDVLNVCIPFFGEKFTSIVGDIIINNNPKLTIIHSSLQPAFIKNEKTVIEKIINYTDNKNVVHSPVRGVHPNLYSGLKEFVKFIGAEDDSVGLMAKEHIESLGIETFLTTSRNTELSKLLSTSYYGICIAFTEEMGKMCDESGADFDVVVRKWNETYNEGYKKLDKPNVVRPVLYRLENETIGGHCVIPNAKLLKEKFNTDVFDPILKYDN